MKFFKVLLVTLISQIAQISSFKIIGYQITTGEEVLKCFTCDLSDTNDHCNRKSIDEPCSTNSTHCFATFDVNTQVETDSIMNVEKKCAKTCSKQGLSCYFRNPNDETHLHCEYCCQGNLCNQELNYTTLLRRLDNNDYSYSYYNNANISSVKSVFYIFMTFLYIYSYNL